MSLISVVSWSLLSGYKTLLGAGRDPSCSLTSKGSTEAENAVMKHLQKLLLTLLLVTGVPARAKHSWNRMEGRGEGKTRSTPYLAYLQGENNSFCGGFLVAPNWVMTAAQCLAYKPLTVILGAHTIQKREESWQTFEVQEYYRHPEFRNPKNGKDILLLKLKGNATSNNYVRTISFEKSKVASSTKCSVAGWGHKTSNGELRETTVTIIDSRDCLNLYPGLADNLICGLSKSPGVPEKSDAGDPLVCNNKAYGIFSYRHNSWPGFYTRIAPYLHWVDSVMKSA
ncbi:granzyme M [Phaenicophaeus curvirostris]|uniref:granzyme M n=1 Tax=Phaenicophaeus curvirostris TaxID=33595 RepID=UPI0037F0E524